MIALECISLAYDDNATALVDVTLAVHAGEQVQVVGPSGSGKTTLARLLAGRTGGDAGTAFRGALTLEGTRLEFGTGTDPRIDPAAWSSRVGYVAQGAWGQLSMMSSTVAEEIAFGPANRGMPAGQLRTTVRDIAAKLQLTDLLERDPRTLSGGQLQRTVIAAAIASEPQVLVLDEPFQGLDESATADVAAVLELLRAHGTGLVVCEPLLPRRLPVDARVLALFEGSAVFEGPPGDARGAGLRRYGVGLEGAPPRLSSAGRGPTPAARTASPTPAGAAGAASVTPARAAGVAGLTPARGRPAGDPPDRAPGLPESRPKGDALLVELECVSFTYPAQPDEAPAGIRSVDFSLERGEVVALLGSNGSGKSTVLQHLNGLLRPVSGVVRIDGRELGRRPTGKLAATVGYLFQNTDQQLFERTVLREVAYGPRAAGKKRGAAIGQAGDALAGVGLSGYASLHPYELSFVRRRLVALASMIATQPLLWVLDEPTAGLDDEGRNLIGELIRAHAATGGGVVLATHDVAFAEAVSDRTVTLAAGRVLPAAGSPASEAPPSQ
ncbi:ABC transporter ATP-binding protein [Arthrobacter sp. Br18]|uniref:ABC transporter ATP-binding protein n=1 Tax=Arthrobacter sp. Br18 TaxID=1312954 RepID=UPI0004BCECD5|nr:ABC transporter ATP-binding protein [Arthrobacter sp. Br18]